MRKLLLLFSIVLLFSVFSCKEYGFDACGSDWMSMIDGDVLLTDISIPGTHDSCAYFDPGISATAKAQSLTLLQQLQAGVRYVDLRPFKLCDTMLISHGPVIQTTFDRAIGTLLDFLDEHSGETVIAGILPEFLDEDFVNIYPYLCDIRDNSELKDRFVFGADISDLELSDCRGKIVVVSRYSSASQGMEDIFCSNYLEYGVPYKTTDVPSQWDIFVDLFDQSCTSGLKTIYLACYFEGQLGIPHIKIASSYLDPKLDAYLDGLDASRKKLGVIVCDYIDEELCRKIYLRNELNFD